jgi:hypothetical protein
MSVVAGLLGNQIDAVAANGVHWGSRSALVVAVSHFLELDADLEVLGSGHCVGLVDDEVDALWSHVRAALDSFLLWLHVTLLTARGE